MALHFEHNCEHLPSIMYDPVAPTPVASPVMMVTNGPLAEFLGLVPDDLTSSEALRCFSGCGSPEGSRPVALAYAGHQFGHLVPRLGDGRAILLGELRGRDGHLYDVQLKGAGRTRFSRGGDGRAAIGPVLREYLVSEAMAALGVPTTRSLCAVATGEPVYRKEVLPGAILTRVARSHLRIGTFEYAAMHGGPKVVSALTDYALARLYPGAPAGEPRALLLLDLVTEAQAALVAQWMALGFVHGVMNTDNMSISGETIDYGPCAFLDSYSPTRVFSSIDRNGRYAYGQQSACAHWNLARLAEALWPLLVDQGIPESEASARLTEILDRFQPRYHRHYQERFGRKLGLETVDPDDATLIQDLLGLMASHQVDFTLAFRLLVDAVGGASGSPFMRLFHDDPALLAWLARWRARLAAEAREPSDVMRLMKAANPALIPRNHQVEAALAAAAQGDFSLFRRLHAALATPYADQTDITDTTDTVDLMEPPGEDQWSYRTFCGT